jgi:DNA anti-recombination protein RmuC
MPSDVTREEFEGRVGVLEHEVEGEKLVTRHVLEQTRRNSDDLAAIKTRLGRVESRLDRVESRLDGVESNLGRVEQKVDGLARSLPAIVGEAVREAFREERERKR